jgi:hypothetical protein
LVTSPFQIGELGQSGFEALVEGAVGFFLGEHLVFEFAVFGGGLIQLGLQLGVLDPLLFGFFLAEPGFAGLGFRQTGLALPLLLEIIGPLLQGGQLGRQRGIAGDRLLRFGLRLRELGIEFAPGVRQFFLHGAQVRVGGGELLLHVVVFGAPVLVNGEHRAGKRHEQQAQDDLHDDQDFSDVRHVLVTPL